TFIKAFPFVLNIELSIFEVLQIVNDNFENLRYEGELEPSDAPIQPPTVRPYHEASRADEENPERGRRASGRGGGRRGAVRGERS
ncbi:MAG: hypothetical protein LBQ43_02085, partial [Holosporales bacterium]|nr:hypothetical protein [Holosporales bacterium]